MRRIFAFAGAAVRSELRAPARFEQLMSAALRQDLSKRSHVQGAHTAMHVSNTSEKGKLRAMLLDNSLGVTKELSRLRERLGYGARSPSGRTNSSNELRRQWQLASVLQF